MNERLTSTWAVLDEAHLALRAVVEGVRPGDWTRPTPCARWSVAQVLQHAAGDQLGYAASITGSGGPAFDPFSPAGHLGPVDRPGAGLVDLADEAMRASAAAWATVAQDATAVPTPLPQGKLPGRLAAGACALDAAVHAWDIALATDRPSPLGNALSGELLEVARELVEPLRAWGAYAAILPADPSDDDTAILLRYLGRDPHWTAAPAV
ncbi:TIGR03086 family metal-binding protein [Dactylosporangium sp. CA-052675]|uniref:TIGR03086 family metal-binding protein n=1 Tax=Dactylosporangium sp. CA-052675 TaxID=3239927 RepID=UPI003D93634E